jgi:hypothetical protein
MGGGDQRARLMASAAERRDPGSEGNCARDRQERKRQ